MVSSVTTRTELNLGGGLGTKNSHCISTRISSTISSLTPILANPIHGRPSATIRSISIEEEHIGDGHRIPQNAPHLLRFWPNISSLISKGRFFELQEAYLRIFWKRRCKRPCRATGESDLETQERLSRPQNFKTLQNRPIFPPHISIHIKHT